MPRKDLQAESSGPLQSTLRRRSLDTAQCLMAKMAVSYKLGVHFLGAFIIRALLLGPLVFGNSGKLPCSCRGLLGLRLGSEVIKRRLWPGKGFQLACTENAPVACISLIGLGTLCLTLRLDLLRIHSTACLLQPAADSKAMQPSGSH